MLTNREQMTRDNAFINADALLECLQPTGDRVALTTTSLLREELRKCRDYKALKDVVGGLVGLRLKVVEVHGLKLPLWFSGERDVHGDTDADISKYSCEDEKIESKEDAEGHKDDGRG